MKCKITNVLGDGSRGDWKCDGETTNKDRVCDSCLAAGWTADPMEIAEAIANDPMLSKRVGVVSPIRRDTLFIEEAVQRFHKMFDESMWRDPQDPTIAYNDIERVKDWLRKELLDAYEQGMYHEAMSREAAQPPKTSPTQSPEDIN